MLHTQVGPTMVESVRFKMEGLRLDKKQGSSRCWQSPAQSPHTQTDGMVPPYGETKECTEIVSKSANKQNMKNIAVKNNTEFSQKNDRRTQKDDATSHSSQKLYQELRKDITKVNHSDQIVPGSVYSRVDGRKQSSSHRADVTERRADSGRHGSSSHRTDVTERRADSGRHGSSSHRADVIERRVDSGKHISSSRKNDVGEHRVGTGKHNSSSHKADVSEHRVDSSRQSSSNHKTDVGEHRVDSGRQSSSGHKAGNDRREKNSSGGKGRLRKMHTMTSLDDLATSSNPRSDRLEDEAKERKPSKKDKQVEEPDRQSKDEDEVTEVVNTKGGPKKDGQIDGIDSVNVKTKDPPKRQIVKSNLRDKLIRKNQVAQISKDALANGAAEFIGDAKSSQDLSYKESSSGLAQGIMMGENFGRTVKSEYPIDEKDREKQVQFVAMEFYKIALEKKLKLHDSDDAKLDTAAMLLSPSSNSVTPPVSERFLSPESSHAVVSPQHSILPGNFYSPSINYTNQVSDTQTFSVHSDVARTESYMQTTLPQSPPNSFPLCATTQAGNMVQPGMTQSPPLSFTHSALSQAGSFAQPAMIHSPPNSFPVSATTQAGNMVQPTMTQSPTHAFAHSALSQAGNFVQPAITQPTSSSFTHSTLSQTGNFAQPAMTQSPPNSFTHSALSPPGNFVEPIMTHSSTGNFPQSGVTEAEGFVHHACIGQSAITPTALNHHGVVSYHEAIQPSFVQQLSNSNDDYPVDDSEPMSFDSTQSPPELPSHLPNCHDNMMRIDDVIDQFRR